MTLTVWKKKKIAEFPSWAQQLTNLTGIHEIAGSIPGLTQWVKDQALPWAVVVGRRYGSDPTLLWPWHRLAATAQIQPLAWEPPYATGAALKEKKKKKKKTTNHHAIMLNVNIQG